MTVLSASRSPARHARTEDLRQRRNEFCRIATAVPPMLGSAALLLVVFDWTPRWEGTVLAGWLTVAAAVLTPLGERCAVRVGLGYRRPTPAQAALLRQTWERALSAARLTAREVELYLQHSDTVNAYATGRRSVAVTNGLLREFAARRLGDDHVVLATLVIAVVQEFQHDQLAPAVLLIALVVSGVTCPLANAALSRRSEYDADRFVVERGAGLQLADGLKAMDGAAPAHNRSRTQRALSRHPSLAHRLEHLDAAFCTCRVQCSSAPTARQQHSAGSVMRTWRPTPTG